MIEDGMTKKEFLASRKAAGRLIDVETCRIWMTRCSIGDPYEIGLDPDCADCIAKYIFVASPASDGAVCEQDLPEDKRRALYARLDRMNHTPTTAEGVRDVLVEEYNLAIARLDDVIHDLVSVTDAGGRFPGVPSSTAKTAG